MDINFRSSSIASSSSIHDEKDGHSRCSDSGDSSSINTHSAGGDKSDASSSRDTNENHHSDADQLGDSLAVCDDEDGNLPDSNNLAYSGDSMNTFFKFCFSTDPSTSDNILSPDAEALFKRRYEERCDIFDPAYTR